jgi:aspartate carbamoyltransferase catalytic subunit
MSIEGQDILSLKDMSRDDMEAIFDVASTMNPREGTDLLRGRVLATLFFEPSTRTRLSFEAAMQRLGGDVLGFASGAASRAGDVLFAENVEDTMQMISAYADIAVIRHPMEGAGVVAAGSSSIPVVLGGDGFYETSEHPTQSLTDLYTIKSVKGTIDGLKIAVVGNATYIRALHSTVYGLSKYDVDLTLVGPKEYPLPGAIREHWKKNGKDFKETESLDDGIEEYDVLYMESIPHRTIGQMPLEQWSRLVEYHLRYRITPERLARAKKDVMVTHTMPRSDTLGFQIYKEIDETPNAKYFEQAANAVPVRMAIMAMVLGAV